MATRAYIEPEDVSKMEKAAGNLRDRLLIRMTFWMGCRVTEVLGINVQQDINFEQGFITIVHLKTRITRTCPICQTRLSKTANYCPGCSNKVIEVREKANEQRRLRQVPIDRETLALLEEYIERDQTQGRLFDFGRTHAWHIITSAATKAGLGKLINPATGKIHNVSPHKLRDAFAVMAVKYDDSMDSVRALQEQLGHASINTTMKYRKVASDEQRKWYDKMSGTNGRQLGFMKE